MRPSQRQFKYKARRYAQQDLRRGSPRTPGGGEPPKGCVAWIICIFVLLFVVSLLISLARAIGHA